MSDPWTRQRDLDASRLRMAALSVQLAAGDGAIVTVEEGGGFVVEVPSPWWSFATLGLWRAVVAKKVIARCQDRVPRICGFCPQIEVRKCRR